MNTLLTRLIRRKWFWPVASLFGLVLAGCTVITVVTVISIVWDSYNCLDGESCAPVIGDIVRSNSAVRCRRYTSEDRRSPHKT